MPRKLKQCFTYSGHLQKFVELKWRSEELAVSHYSNLNDSTPAKVIFLLFSMPGNLCTLFTNSAPISISLPGHSPIHPLPPPEHSFPGNQQDQFQLILIFLSSSVPSFYSTCLITCLYFVCVITILIYYPRAITLFILLVKFCFNCINKFYWPMTIS